METLTLMLINVAGFVVVASLKATAVVALVLLVQKVFERQLSAGGRYLLWLAVIASLVSPVGFSVPVLPPQEVSPVVAELGAELGAAGEREEFAAESAVFAPRIAGDSGIAEPAGLPGMGERIEGRAGAVVPGSTFSLWTLLAAFWLSGVVAVLVVAGTASLRLVKMTRQGRAAPPALKVLLDKCAERAGCHAPVVLLVSAEVSSPMISGLFRPVLLWPRGLESELTPEQIVHVFMHELMHVKRHDMPGSCVIGILQALHWFNPAIWIAFACLRHDREMACDAAVLKHLDAAEKGAYAHTLLHLGTSLPRTAVTSVALGILDNRTRLRSRILMLVPAQRKHWQHTLLALCLLAVLIIPAFGQPVPGSAEPQTQNVPAVIAAEDRPEVVMETSMEPENDAADIAGFDVAEPEAPDTATPMAVQADTVPEVPASTTPVLNSAPEADAGPVPEQALSRAGPAVDSLITGSSQQAQAPLMLAQVDVTEAAQSEPPGVVAAVPQASEETVPGVPGWPEVAVADDNETAGSEVAGAVCVLLLAAESGAVQRVCDSQEMWREHAPQLGMDADSLLAAAATGDEVIIELSYEVCRASGWRGKRVCRTRAEWAAIEARNRGTRYAPPLRPYFLNDERETPMMNSRMSDYSYLIAR